MRVNPLVVDLSHYQNVRDWGLVRSAGIAGVINKVSEGSTNTDKTFALRRKAVRAAGLLFGGYHFLRPVSIKVQVEHFLLAADPDPELLLALDHEDPAVPLAGAKEFLERVKEKTGAWPVLYSGFLAKQQLGDRVDPELVKVRLWLSHYSNSPSWPKTWAAPWLWQFTGDGKGPLPHTIAGIDGSGLDINSFEGDSVRLAAEWTGTGVSIASAPVVPRSLPEAPPARPPADAPAPTSAATPAAAVPTKPAGLLAGFLALLKALFGK